MRFEFRLPDLGEYIEQAQVSALWVAEGEFVREDQPILEVETDTAAVDIPVPYGGRVSRLVVRLGDVVRPGQTLIVIDPVESVDGQD